MKILIVGGLNLNPDRFLPIIAEHDLYGMWESRAFWSVSVPAGGSYNEIPDLRMDDVGGKGIDIIWSLLSPWDGIDLTLKLMSRYPDIPVIRQSQGAVTPWWHDASHPANKARGANYSFSKFKRVLQGADGLMFNAEKYRACLIDQGADIENKPWLLANGMAFNADLITEPAPKKLSSIDGQSHISVIGQIRHDMGYFAKNGIHVHYHSVGRKDVSTNPYIHIEEYMGDGKKLSKKPISIQGLFSYKKKAWYKTFARYDAGIMHLARRELSIYRERDMNVPGRVNTYIMCGLPPIIWDEDSSIRDFLAASGCALAFKSEPDLMTKLKDKEYMHGLQNQTLKVRKDFSMQHEIRRVTDFFEGLLR